ncbi:hypothetical protein ETU09_00590 [Apibacter muscae]|uniref:Uncharacterized protein n=1 Tax=Apibacter muscae TaxID=2509004 RepID=A0A563DKQ5_9FLAO|nr:hypothetical protein [Apibacter muscae]TWP30531.1 hypothetical protein ETU09_00590 [Apibacter muscae]
MKTITSKSKLLDKLKKNNLLTNGVIFYLSDFHRTKVGKSVANKIICENLVIPTHAMCSWFEREWKLNKEL